jgi:hypothetical protein
MRKEHLVEREIDPDYVPEENSHCRVGPERLCGLECARGPKLLAAGFFREQPFLRELLL